MNMTSLPRKSSGFTLVELLTVIAIIAILMGILFPTINAILENAKKTQARNDALQIVNSIKAYYTEYGKYPCLAPNAGDDSGDYVAGNNPTGTELMDALRVPDPAGTYALNPRKVVFLEIPSVKNDAVGKRKNGIASDGRYYDPWGNVYFVKMDNNYNGTLTNPYDANTGAGFGSINTGVICWSIGRDAAGGSGNKGAGTSKDDVISWQ